MNCRYSGGWIEHKLQNESTCHKILLVNTDIKAACYWAHMGNCYTYNDEAQLTFMEGSATFTRTCQPGNALVLL